MFTFRGTHMINVTKKNVMQNQLNLQNTSKKRMFIIYILNDNKHI